TSTGVSTRSINSSPESRRLVFVSPAFGVQAAIVLPFNKTLQFMNLLQKSLDSDPCAPMAAWGDLILRAGIGVMIFYVHGWHKLEGLIAYLQHGTPWKLAEEVAGMHFLAPFPSAVAATLVQFICSLFVTAGLFTRINS